MGRKSEKKKKRKSEKMHRKKPTQPGHLVVVCSPPDSPVHGILQARTLEWVVIPFSKGSSRPWDGTCISCTCRRVLYHLSILRAGGGLHNIWGRKWMLEEERLMQERKCKNFPESGEWAGPEQQPRGEHGGFVMAICSWIQA